jgi:ferric-dicitrate binding protein FerR (iron transport regulator)
MTSNETNDKARVQGLMMGALDGEISAEEQRELDGILARDSEVRAEWDRLKRVKEVTGAMTYREPPEEIWDEYWVSVYNRTERGIAWILVSMGGVVVLAYGAWKFLETLWADANAPGFLKLAIMAVAVGLIVLAISVIREKLFTNRRDPYKEIER